jgi:hypothetical protein
MAACIGMITNIKLYKGKYLPFPDLVYMNPASSLKKILTTALLSSLIVGIFAYASIAIASPRPFFNFPGSLLVLVLRIAGMWMVNIALVYLIGKFIQRKGSVYIRYAASYIICVFESIDPPRYSYNLQ